MMLEKKQAMDRQDLNRLRAILEQDLLQARRPHAWLTEALIDLSVAFLVNMKYREAIAGVAVLHIEQPAD